MILAYSSYPKLVYDVTTGHMTLRFEIFWREIAKWCLGVSMGHTSGTASVFPVSLQISWGHIIFVRLVSPFIYIYFFFKTILLSFWTDLKLKVWSPSPSRGNTYDHTVSEANAKEIFVDFYYRLKFHRDSVYYF